VWPIRASFLSGDEHLHAVPGTDGAAGADAEHPGLGAELAVEGDRWVQRNLTNGEAVELLLPWEIDPREWSDKRFDGLRPKRMPK